MGELQRTTAETETNFQCGNFESWKKDQIMIHILCLTRHTYEKTLFVKICNAQSTFFPNLETFIFNNSFLKVKGPSRSFLKRWEYQIILPVSWETCMQVKKQQIESDMKEWAGSILRNEYVKVHVVTLLI